MFALSPRTGRVLDALTILVSLVTVVVAVVVLVNATVGTARAGGDRGAPIASATAAPASGAVTQAPASPSPTATPTASPAIIATRYLSGGHAYAGLDVPTGTTVTAALDGTVEIRTYQLIDGNVRVGSNVPSLPFYPYVTVVSATERMIYRPGALGSDVELLAADGQQIRVGGALFRQLGPGRSSWSAFYDPAARFQVVVSAQAVPSGLDLDPLTFF
jgi:hypothetical protein